jgi:cellulose synthase/poly-beta-1,6-N-acetylglucosamine synthase-like glycosyltransferase
MTLNDKTGDASAVSAPAEVETRRPKTGSKSPWGLIQILLFLAIEAMAVFGLTYFLSGLRNLSFSGILAVIYIVAQILYLFTFIVMFYFIGQKINWVDKTSVNHLSLRQMPKIILLYPVLHEAESTMNTAMAALNEMDYPKNKYQIIALPNYDDLDTIASLERLQENYSFLKIMQVPPTTDSAWDVVWQAWEKNPKAYWWHQGKTQKARDLPPKKTRQLIWAFYTLVDRIGTNWVLDYIDADSITPANHFKLAAAGLQYYDVLQSTNVVGNLLDTPDTALHTFDHMVWDGNVYPHMSANGRHPFYVLGKGLFYKASDLSALGGFNPWITIEDPEIGMRFWVNGKRLGIIEEPLIEEVPQRYFNGGIHQRNRWMCGFFQSLGSPLKRMGMSFRQRMLARLNLIPVLSHPANLIGLPSGVFALILYFKHIPGVSVPVVALSSVNIAFFMFIFGYVYTGIWKRSRLVIDSRVRRFCYMLWVNPITYICYALLWCIPIAIGFGMYVTDRGKAWKRTEKVDADHFLVSHV